MTHLRMSALAAAAALATLALATAAEAQRVRYQCSAFGATDISMTSRYEIRGTGATARRKFTTEFEAGPRTGFPVGSRIRVQVKGVFVGSALLEQVGTDTVADLNFDTIPQVDARPFPANWPAGVGRGTVVRVYKGTTSVLGCTLG